MSSSSLFAPDFKPLPYWWERTPPGDVSGPQSPARADAVVVGSGYTGLNAALQLARDGRATVVLDAHAPGWGCSTRNGGQVGTSVKPGLAALTKTYGQDRAREILAEGRRSLAWLGEFIAAEGIACDFRVSGRFHGAHSTRQYRKLQERIAALPEEDRSNCQLVSPDSQQAEIGTAAYHGGVLYRHHAALDPALYHCALLQRVRKAGAEIVPHCRVSDIEPWSSGFRVITASGAIEARNVIVATNGYTGGATPWLRRRVIPIGSSIIATEPLPPGVVDELLPTDRMVTDTRKVVFYYRASPDRTRILFGGRVTGGAMDPKRSARRLHAEMSRIFPQLAGIRVSHSWMGLVAYTFDTLMHAGRHDGIHYAAGYCGSGVGMSSYLGMKIGLQVLGKAEGDTPFSSIPFPGRSYYWGYPWFLSPAITFYRLSDRLT